MARITLLTDFGLEDEYVGVMKGVIATIAPHAQVFDLTHGIDPQDVVQGAYILAAAYPYFPAGTIHVAIVDPGVGGNRRMVAMACDGHRFVAPDNGILNQVLARQPKATAVYIENRDCFLHPVSHTFHGRDIFAPVAARLATGFPLEKLGPRVNPEQLWRGKASQAFSGENDTTGQVIAIDHFGNLMTTIHSDSLFEKPSFRKEAPDIQITLCGRSIIGISDSYDCVAQNTLLAIIGSRGLLEISVNAGNAQKQLGAKKGDMVHATRIRLTPAVDTSKNQCQRRNDHDGHEKMRKTSS